MMPFAIKRLLITLGLLAVAIQHCPAAEWFTDVPAALARARAENKAVLLDFTGSDWCGWCIRLKQEVFDQPEFAAYAQANLILVEVDFPRRKALSHAQQVDNARLAQRHDIHGYPTIIVLNSAGQRIGTTGYLEGGPKNFISQLETFPGLHNAGSQSEPEKPAKVAPKPAPPTFAPPAPIHYGEITLKGISGTSGRQLALINNQTIMVGETAKVKSRNATVEVTVKSITNESVVVFAEGRTLELKLSQR